MSVELMGCIVIILVIMLLMIHEVVRDKTNSYIEIIRKPFKYIIDILDDSITVYELDKGSTGSCNHKQHYYTSYLFMDSDIEVVNKLSMSKEKNKDFIYTDDIEEVTTILKQKRKLLDWFMTRITV